MMRRSFSGSGWNRSHARLCVRKLGEVSSQHRMGMVIAAMLCCVVTMLDSAHLFQQDLLHAEVLMKDGSAQDPVEHFHKTHQAMGTEFSIDIYGTKQAEADRAMDIAFDEIDRLEDLLSNYRSSSELSRISREASTGPVTTDPETFQFLQQAFAWSERSKGAFDMTVGPLLRSWGFFFHSGRVPSESELAALRPNVGWRNVRLDPQTRTVTFLHGRSIDLDPGSIGKGFAVDHVVALLRQLGITSAFISAGGSTLFAIGVPPGGSGWPVDVPDPLHPGRIASRVLLKDSSLSTGACTQKFFIRKGHRYCHIFDPKRLRPVEDVLQTSVIDPSATDSDALSTVVFVLNPSSSRHLIESIPEGKALIFRRPAGGRSCFDISWPGDPCGQTQNPLRRGDQ
jgi:FAD:protein FMN transferase